MWEMKWLAVSGIWFISSIILTLNLFVIIKYGFGDEWSLLPAILLANLICSTIISMFFVLWNIELGASEY